MITRTPKKTRNFTEKDAEIIENNYILIYLSTHFSIKMYYSEFTLKLIEEVKKREILYNTKYEKRPRQEKEEAWRDVGSVLNGL